MKPLPNRTIACLDMTSFYASCAAADLGLDVMEEAIAIIGNLEQKGSVLLAASPRMKKEFGVKTGTRLFEIPNHTEIRLIELKMQFFVDLSMGRFYHSIADLFLSHGSRIKSKGK